MPTYRYRCGSCGDDFEVWQSITDDALTEHEGCGGGLVKVLSPAGIVLKGSGFYKTDSRKASSGNGKSTSKESKESKPADTSTSDSSKSDSSSSTSDSSSTKKDASTGSGSSSSSGSGTKSGSST